MYIAWSMKLPNGVDVMNDKQEIIIEDSEQNVIELLLTLKEIQESKHKVEQSIWTLNETVSNFETSYAYMHDSVVKTLHLQRYAEDYPFLAKENLERAQLRHKRVGTLLQFAKNKQELLNNDTFRELVRSHITMAKKWRDRKDLAPPLTELAQPITERTISLFQLYRKARLDITTKVQDIQKMHREIGDIIPSIQPSRWRTIKFYSNELFGNIGNKIMLALVIVFLMRKYTDQTEMIVLLLALGVIAIRVVSGIWGLWTKWYRKVKQTATE